MERIEILRTVIYLYLEGVNSREARAINLTFDTIEQRIVERTPVDCV